MSSTSECVDIVSDVCGSRVTWASREAPSGGSIDGESLFCRVLFLFPSCPHSFPFSTLFPFSTFLPTRSSARELDEDFI